MIQKKLILFCLLATGLVASATAKNTDWLDQYNLVWSTASQDSLDSMPLSGRHGAGANVWVQDGSIWLYLAHNGAYDEQGRLLKLGCVRLTPMGIKLGGEGFRQELDPATGTITIQQGDFKASLWFADQTLVFESETAKPDTIEVAFASWRDKPLENIVTDMHNHREKFSADHIQAGTNGFVWFHRNADAPIDLVAKAKSQGISADTLDDCTTRRVFGGAIAVAGNISEPVESNVQWQFWDGKAWTGRTATAKQQIIAMRLGGALDANPQQWQTEANAMLKSSARKSAKADELKRWTEFWNRSHIVINAHAATNDPGWLIGRNYQLFRYMLACNRDGELPLLFNGGIFTTDNNGRIKGNNNDELPIFAGQPITPDFRRWMYCHFMSQNQRWLGWPTLANGDADLLSPSLAFYRDRSATAAARAKENGADGVVYPEPLDVWGLCCVAPRPDGLCGAEHLTHHFSMMLEHAWMALQARDALGISIEKDLPWIAGTVFFYDSFYRAQTKQRTGKELGDDGKLVIYPANGLELARGATDPIEVVCGLKRITAALLAVPEISPAARARLAKIQPTLPDLPTGKRQGVLSLLPAKSWEREYNKWEPIEMYAFWPYRFVGITQPDTLQLARDTWETIPEDRARLCKQDYSWMANVVNMAALAWPEKAKERAIYKMANTAAPQARFPAFFGPGHDWLPDHNWGGSGSVGIQEMILAPEPGPNGKLNLFPAWPKEWDVDFKLHAPGQTIVDGVLRGGRLQSLKVTPASRAKDIVNWLDKQPAYTPVPAPSAALNQGKNIAVSTQSNEPANGTTENATGLTYHPDGDAIVITNGTRWENRPLYCHERFSLVWSGEMPALRGEMGTLYFGLQRGGQRVLLQHFSNRVMRYRAGAMEWEFADARFPGLKIRLTATTLADANGVTARLEAIGVQPGDNTVWCFFPPEADKGVTVQAKLSNAGLEFARTPDTPLTQIHVTISPVVAKWEQLAYADREDLSRAVPFANDLKPGAGLVAFVPLDDQPQFVALAAADNDAPGFGRLVLRHEPLDLAKIADPAKAFAGGLARVDDFAGRVKVSTPDSYLNAAMPAAVAASAGDFVNPTFVHGGSQWRQQQPGWRTMGGAIYYGWPDQVRRAVDFWGKFQVQTNGDKTNAVFSANGCQQAGNSLFFGAGWIDYQQPPHYDFQTQFFDEAVRAWRATGDRALENFLKPMLELHLEHCRACFDPDGDGLYESYNNTWPSDSIWFNGGGTPEESAYVYYGERAAADMCQHAGDTAGAAKHNAVAEKIRRAVNAKLWMPERGQFASFVEAGGHHRQMSDAWAYGECIPIEAGLATPEQAWQAMFYTKSAFERFILPYGGELRQTSNFLPGMWSVREIFGGDNYMMALGYFLAGQGDDGWQILRGTMLESMYGDGVPKSGYSNERGEFNLVNRISPGGLSHPNCAIDFTDISSMFARAVVEGLFGYRPDYPNGGVKIEPSFPSAWEHASIRTPDFALEFRTNTYRVQLTKPAAIKFGLPVRAEKIASVTANGRPVKFTVEPWAGCGMLRLEIPSTNFAEVVIESEGAAVQLPALTEEKPDGTPGAHLEMKKISGSVPRYQFTEVHVPEQPNPNVLREAPAGAHWQFVDMTGEFNGDVRGIFKQKYLSPRPATCSMRLGDDGWSAWTFHWWGIPTPEIKLDKTGEPLTTPQCAQFAKIGAEKNIAFTSLWDNWPKSVTVPVNAAGDAVWLLVCGSTTPMQGKIANAVLRFHYVDGKDETLDLTPPDNFWSLCKFGRQDYNYQRDGFSLPKTPPPQVQLGENCRAMVYGWKLRPGVKLTSVTLETLSQDVVIGLMGVSVMNPL